MLKQVLQNLKKKEFKVQFLRQTFEKEQDVDIH